MRKPKKAILLLLSGVALLVLLLGCASIISKSDYTVAFKSQPDKADIVIMDETGKTVFEGTTPTTVSLTAKAGFFNGMDYTIRYSKEGYKTHEAKLESGLDGWYIANIALGGLLGMLIIDPATGAMWALPEEMVATLTPETTSINNKASSLKVVTLSDVPTELRGKLISIN